MIDLTKDSRPWNTMFQVVERLICLEVGIKMMSAGRLCSSREASRCLGGLLNDQGSGDVSTLTSSRRSA